MSPNRPPRDDISREEPHPSYDPSGTDVAGSSDGLPDRASASDAAEPSRADDRESGDDERGTDGARR
jgi:hypothetical protein